MDMNQLAQFFLDQEATLEIDLPNGEPMVYNGQRVSITLFGPSTDEFATAKAEHDKAATVRVVAAVGNKKPKTNGVDPDVKYLAAITKSVNNLPLTPHALYSEPRLQYVNRQVFAHIGDMANFFGKQKAN